MKFLTAIEDLVRSLERVPGTLGKLYFLAGLRQEGKYEHWGLARAHGEQQAEGALKNAHRGALDSVLTAPLDELAPESDQQELPPPTAAEKLVPDQPGPASKGHLKWILKVLSLSARR